MSQRGPATPEFVADTFDKLEPGRAEPFDELARAAFEFQRSENPVYRRFCGDRPWQGSPSVPYLPVAAFKETTVASFPVDEAEHCFLSSATGSGRQSRHYVISLGVYRRSFSKGFTQRFGAGPFTFLAHLPGYAAQGETSSLLYMVDGLIRSYGDAYSGFFLDDVRFLKSAASYSRDAGSPFVLFGAAFGLLDLLESGDVPLPAHAVVIETGGMKMHRRDVSRDALHSRLSAGFHVPAEQIFSEYGMCEMLSQCYTRGGNVFYPPPWVRFQVVDPQRPDQTLPKGSPGVLAVFDLANVYSVCSLLTEDRAVSHGDGFEVLGRLTGAELRGCNYLLANAGFAG